MGYKGDTSLLITEGVRADEFVFPLSAFTDISDATVEEALKREDNGKFIRLTGTGGNVNHYGIGPLDLTTDKLMFSMMAVNGGSGTFALWLTNDDNGLAQPRANATINGSLTGNAPEGRWRDVVLDISEFTDDGGMDFSDVQGIRFDPNISAGSIIIGNFRIQRRVKPVICFILDDGSATQLSNRKEFINREIPVSWAVSRDNIDGSAVRTNDIHMALAEGLGEVILHGSTNLTTLSSSALKTELNEAIAWNRARGFDTTHYVYPNGATNDTVKQALTDAGIEFARALERDSETKDTHHLGFPDPLEIVPDTLTTADVVANEASMDNAVLRGMNQIFTIHAITASGATGNETNLSDLQTILDAAKVYRDNGQAEIMVFSELCAKADAIRKSIINT